MTFRCGHHRLLHQQPTHHRHHHHIIDGTLNCKTGTRNVLLRVGNKEQHPLIGIMITRHDLLHRLRTSVASI
jgi:hypothetical protein